MKRHVPVFTAMVAVSLGLLSFVPAAMAKYEAPPPELVVKDEAPPTEGTSTTLVTTGVLTQDQPIVITYSPSSNVAETESVTAGGTHLILWRPKRPGVVEIAAPGHAPKRISVRFAGTPLSGIIIMILAGLILFGGAFVSLRALLASE